MGIIDEKYIINHVKDNLWQLKKDDLISIILDFKLDISISKYKDDLIEDIKNQENIDFMKIYLKYKDESFAVTSKVLEELLSVNEKVVKKLNKKEWIKSPYKIYEHYPCYSLFELLSLENSDIEEFVKKYCKPPTEKQLAAIKKAQEANIRIRTCSVCGRIVKHKNRLSEGKCSDCIFEEERESIRDVFKSFLENKDKYVILDTETTGLSGCDRIIEISIIDLDGNILLDTLVYTDVQIDEEAYMVNGITKEMLSNKPTIKELSSKLNEIFKDKTVLIYNSDFDTRMLYQSGYKNNINTECLMHLYMDLCGSDRFISLSNAMMYEGVHTYQNHRALGDCNCCLALIKAISNK